ncbi:hypothetical protein SMICM17S_08197 [Streptomyces microflavus]
MSIAYVCPYTCVPWLGTLSAGLFRADQRPVTGGSTSTAGRSFSASFGPLRLSANPMATATTAGTKVRPKGSSGSAKTPMSTSATKTSQHTR